MVQQIKDHPACALWVDMGLGKTVSTLTALRELKDEFEVHRTLVIAPLRVANKTWPDELEEWAHLGGFSFSRVTGTAAQRRAGMRKRADLYFINRENVAWLVGEHFDDLEKPRPRQIRPWIWDTVVIDESSSFKGHASQRFEHLKFVRRLFDRIIELTGTPSPHSLMDLWSQIYLLDRGATLGRTITDFRKRFFEYDHYSSKWEPRPHAEDVIKNLLGDRIISMNAEDYLELPPVVNNYIRVSMTDAERKQYEKMKRTAVLELAESGKKITAVNAGVLFGKLLQMSNGAVYTDDQGNWELLHDHKIDALMEILEFQENLPAIVVYNYKSDLARIKKALSRTKLKFKEIREKGAEAEWDRGELDVLILHPASAGHGLNLHKSGCRNMTLFGLNPSLELYMQVIARLTGGHRRQAGVVINHIVCDRTQDDTVIDILKHRGDQQGRIKEAVKVLVGEYARAA
jgi:SNF2 family DNA or RNA helicase